MDIITKEYRLLIYDRENQLVYRAKKDDLYHVIRTMLGYLKKYNALDLAEHGSFVVTKPPFLKHEVVKRYEVLSILPYSRFIIHKTSKGSIDTEEFLSILKYIKGGMNARVRHKTTNDR